MGFLSASTSICYFQVKGAEDYHQGTDESIRNKLVAEAFRSIEQSADELSTGWVEFGDEDCGDFAEPQSCWRDHYLCFSLRQDRRRVPAALLKRHFAHLCGQFLAAHPTYHRVPKSQREQLRDQAREVLLARTLPTPSVTNLIWDTRRHLIRYCSLGKNSLDSFQSLFHQTFPGLRLHLLSPLERAQQVLPQELQTALNSANQAQTDSTLEMIEANRWLGTDFFFWLFYRTLNTDSLYGVKVSGPLLEKQPFHAFLDNRLVLVGGGQEGIQRIVVAGPQDQFLEVKTALSQGKAIEEATIHLRQDDDHAWKLTLKGERFAFGNLLTPMLRAEGDPQSDPVAEAEAAFLTKMTAVEEGEQLFDSLLKSFLEIRLSGDWPAEMKKITDWIKE